MESDWNFQLSTGGIIDLEMKREKSSPLTRQQIAKLLFIHTTTEGELLKAIDLVRLCNLFLTGTCKVYSKKTTLKVNELWSLYNKWTIFTHWNYSNHLLIWG